MLAVTGRARGAKRKGCDLMDAVLYNAVKAIKKAFTVKALDGSTDTTAQNLLSAWGDDVGNSGSMQAALDTFKTAIDTNLFASGGVLANNSAIKSINQVELNLDTTSATFAAAVNPEKCVVLSRITYLCYINNGCAFNYKYTLTASGISAEFNYYLVSPSEKSRATVDFTIIEFY